MQHAAGAYAIAAVSVFAATIARLLLDPLLEDRHVFSLFYVAVVVSAWHGGFKPALAATAVGYVAAEWLFVHPRGALAVAELGGLVASVTYAAVALALVAVTGAARRASRRNVRVAAELSELESVARAVRIHRINSREVVSYLEGLNAGPETFIAVAQYEDFDLEPDELAARLEALAREAHRSHAASV